MKSAPASCESYLEMETEENLQRGLSPEDARAAAQRKLGGPLRIREEIYDMNTVGLIENAWQDLKLRGARAAAQSRLRGGGHPVPGPGRRRQHGHLPARQRRAPARPAGGGSRRPRADRDRGPQGRDGAGHRPLPADVQRRCGSASATARRDSLRVAAWATATFDLSDGGEVRNADGHLGERRLLPDGGSPRGGRTTPHAAGRRARAAPRRAWWSAIPSGSASWPATRPPSAAPCAWTAAPARSWA